MSPILRAVPAICFVVAAIVLLGQGYFVARVMIYGVGLDFDLTRDMWPQFAGAWLKIIANSSVWVAFGLLARLLIRSIDELKAVTSARANGISGDA